MNIVIVNRVFSIVKGKPLEERFYPILSYFLNKECPLFEIQLLVPIPNIFCVIHSGILFIIYFIPTLSIGKNIE